MADGKKADQLASQAAEAVRRVVSEAEQRAAEIIREAETQAAKIRERAESDARGQIEAAKRALDELGGTLAAAASSALPKAESEPQPTETEEEQPPGPHPDPEPETEQEPAESPGAPEAPVSPPAEEPEPEQAASAVGNGDDAAERLLAMKMAVDGKDQTAIEAELTEKFGARNRTELVADVLSRVPR